MLSLTLFTYNKTLTNQQPTYLYNSLSFPSHSVSTRSSDSLVLSIPYVRSSLDKRAFSVIGPRLWNSLPPDTRNSEFSTSFSFQAQNTPLQNCIPSLGSFPSPWTVYPDFDSCYSHFITYRMTPSVRPRAIEVHYYYYYLYYYYYYSDVPLEWNQVSSMCIHANIFYKICQIVQFIHLLHLSVVYWEPILISLELYFPCLRSIHVLT